MATPDSVKIALKSRANMSLNERFQLLRQNQMKRQNNGLNANYALNSNKSIPNNSRLQLRQGSQKNRRLALQMANRPSVLAALRAHNNHNHNTQPIKQRLGIKRFNNQTINRNNNNLNRIQIQRNRNPNPINRSNLNNRLNQNRNNNQNTVQTQNRRNNYQNIGVVVGVRRRAPAKLQNLKQKNRLRRTQAFKPMPNVMRSGLKQKRRVGQQIRNQNQTKSVKTGVKRGFRINRNFNARSNSGKETPQKRRNVKPNREQLDNDLDQYMAGTKSYLDAELDAYMSQTN